MDNVVALFHAQRTGDVVAGRTQHRQQPFTGRVAALFQQILAEARLGMQRIVIGPHQHQDADAVAALEQAFLHQLIHRPTQRVAVHRIVIGELLLGGQIVTAAITLFQRLLQLGGNGLIDSGRMSG